MLSEDVTHILTGKAVIALADGIAHSNSAISISVHGYDPEHYKKIEAVEQVHDKHTRWKTVQVTEQVRITYFPAGT